MAEVGHIGWYRRLLAAVLVGSLPASLACGRAAPETAVTRQPAVLAPSEHPRIATPLPPPSPDDSVHGPSAHVVDLRMRSARVCVVLDGGLPGCASIIPAVRRIEREQRGHPWAEASDPPLVAVTVPGFPPAFALTVAVGQDHACVLLRERGVACWGDNARGQLGSRTGSEGPPPQPVPGLSNVASLELGWATSYAVGDDGAAWSWGAADDGGLADGATQDRDRAGRIPGLADVRQISDGGRHACALTRTGEVLCWGANDFGQLATSSPAMSSRPRPVGVHGAVAIGAGDRRSCALGRDGRVICWGMLGYETPRPHSKTYGRSPDLPALPDALRGPFLWTPTPSPVPGVTGAIELSCGDDVDCVRDSEGAACWTAGLHGPGADAMPPTRLPVAGVVRVVAGLRAACVLDVGGVVTCFSIRDGRVGLGEVLRVAP